MGLNKKIWMLLVAGIITAGGCCSSRLPDGMPPTGPIVQPNAATVMNETAAINFLSTSMSAALLNSFPPGSTIVCNKEYELPEASWRRLPEQVLRSGSDLFAFREETNAVIVLQCRIVSTRIVRQYRWEMELRQNGRSLWKDTAVFQAASSELR